MRSASSLRLSASTPASAAAASVEVLARDLALLERFAELGGLLLGLVALHARLAFFVDRPAFAIGFSGIGLCLAMYPASATSATVAPARDRGKVGDRLRHLVATGRLVDRRDCSHQPHDAFRVHPVHSHLPRRRYRRFTRGSEERTLVRSREECNPKRKILDASYEGV